MSYYPPQKLVILSFEFILLAQSCIGVFELILALFFK
jgi:hypothetical protein